MEDASNIYVCMAAVGLMVVFILTVFGGIVFEELFILRQCKTDMTAGVRKPDKAPVVTCEDHLL